jgi:hypothetical protein
MTGWQKILTTFGLASLFSTVFISICLAQETPITESAESRESTQEITSSIPLSPVELPTPVSTEDTDSPSTTNQQPQTEPEGTETEPTTAISSSPTSESQTTEKTEEPTVSLTSPTTESKPITTTEAPTTTAETTTEQVYVSASIGPSNTASISTAEGSSAPLISFSTDGGNMPTTNAPSSSQTTNGSSGTISIATEKESINSEEQSSSSLSTESNLPESGISTAVILAICLFLAAISCAVLFLLRFRR